MIRWGILGDGAIGALLASRLALRGETVSLLMSQQRGSGQRVIIYRQSNLQLAQQFNITDNGADCDVILIAVKVYQVSEALASITLSSKPVLVTFHNGMGTHAQISQDYPNNPLWAAMTTHGARRSRPFVDHLGQGESWIGDYRQQASRAPLWLERLDNAFAQVHFCPDIQPPLWQKLAINCLINPLTALAQCPNGDLLQSSYQPQIATLCREFSNVANAAGFTMSAETIEARVREVCQATALNRSSMAEDLRLRRRSEIDYINGYLLTQAKRYGIAVPAHQQLVDSIKAQGV